MKKWIVVVAGGMIGAAAGMAGVQTDKIVFEDNTVQATAGGGGAPPGTNSTTVLFDHGYEIRNGETSVMLATSNAALFATNSLGKLSLMNPANGLGLRLQVEAGFDWLVDLGSPGSGFDGPLYVSNGQKALSVKLGDGSNANVPGGKAAIDAFGPVFIRASNDGAALIVTNESKSASAHIGGSAVISGQAGDLVIDAANQGNGRGLFAAYAPWTWEAAFASPGHASGAAGYVSDGTRTVEFADGTYALDVTAGDTRLAGNIYNGSSQRWADINAAGAWSISDLNNNALLYGSSWSFQLNRGMGDKSIDVWNSYLDAGGDYPVLYWAGENAGKIYDAVGHAPSLSMDWANRRLHDANGNMALAWDEAGAYYLRVNNAEWITSGNPEYGSGRLWQRAGYGAWQVETTATQGLEIVNFQTATNLIASPGTDVTLNHELIQPMSDAAGNGADWHYWSAGAAVTNNGSWRMGVLSSNFVVQVRMSGAWTNATVFTRPL